MTIFDTDDLRLLTESVDRFVQDRATDARIDDPGLWKDVAALGWTGTAIGIDNGGMGGGAAALAAVMRGVGRGLLRLPYISTAVLGAGLIERAGSEKQKEDLLPRLIDGDLITALADREPGSGHDRHWVSTTAARIAGGYQLSGSKQFVLDAPIADNDRADHTCATIRNPCRQDAR